MAFEAKPISELPAASELTGLQFPALQDGEAVRVAVALLQSLGFVPLSGTVEGSPVTGPIQMSELSGGRNLYIPGGNAPDDMFYIGFTEGGLNLGYFDSNIGLDTKLIIGSNNLNVTSNDPNSEGVTSNQYFVKSDPNTYAQMADITPRATDIEITDPDAGIILRSLNGNRWRITVDNAGVLNATPA